MKKTLLALAFVTSAIVVAEDVVEAVETTVVTLDLSWLSNEELEAYNALETAEAKDEFLVKAKQAKHVATEEVEVAVIETAAN